MKIENNKVVSLTYDLYIKEDDTESLVESTTPEEPLVFLYGVGQMLPKFEEHLIGLSSGDLYEFQLTAEDAYGEYNDEAITKLPKEMFQGAELPEEGSMLPLQDESGHHFQGQVLAIEEDVVVVDLNHPMAGQNLRFKGQIQDVRDASAEELQHGHVHGQGGHEDSEDEETEEGGI